MSMRIGRFVLPVVALLVHATEGVARAQSAEAQALFDEGRRALASKDYADACAKLEASERLERAVGTLLSLAECEEALGKLANARSHLEEAASWADATHDRLERGPIARSRFAAIDKRVPRLRLRLAVDAPRDSRARRDGVDLGAAAFGSALPIDPGKHVIVVSAPGRTDAKIEVMLNEGEQKTLEVAPGASVAAPPAPPAGPAPVAPPEAPQTPDEAVESSQRTWAYVLGGAGVVGIVVGSVFGLNALSGSSQAKSDCGAGCPDGSSARAKMSDARTDATISTIAFAGGGVALATGVYLFLAAPSTGARAAGVRVAPWVGRGGAGAAVTSAW